MLKSYEILRFHLFCLNIFCVNLLIMFKFKLLFFLLSLSFISFSQNQVIDKVIAVVGKYPILLSDLQNTMLDQDKQGVYFDRCKSFEMLVYQKLLMVQAEKDSLIVSEAELDHELSRRMSYFISQFGSEEKLEEFYGKRTNVIKDELRFSVQEQLLAEKMKSNITGNDKLTPAEIRLFFNSSIQDSLPFVESEVELQQLVKKPICSPHEKQEAKELIESYRERVVNGKSTMSTLARLYSEDPGSAAKGGLYNNVARGIMDPAFEAVAFRLKKGEISNVFETSYGFHFIELVQRKGDLLDLRHILIMPKMTNEDFFKCKGDLDSIYKEINLGLISFENAVKKYSDDLETKQNSGLMINPQTANTKFDNNALSQIDENSIVVLNNMKVGDISKPMQFKLPDGKPGFRILKLKTRIDPHKMNLIEDYQKLAQFANIEKNKKLVKEWIKKRSKISYIKLDPEFACKFENNWTISN